MLHLTKHLEFILVEYVQFRIHYTILIVGLQQGVIGSAQPYGLPLNETIFPQYLKHFGYATHVVGKVSEFLCPVATELLISGSVSPPLHCHI